MRLSSSTLKSFFKIRICILFLLLVFPTQLWAEDRLGTAQHPVRMMFVPSGEAQTILEGGEEIARRLQIITGLHFKTSIATSYAAVIEAMGAGKVDIGWLATFSYVLAKQKYDVDLLTIVVRFGSPFYRGQIITHVDSGIKTLSDLKGRKFAFVDAASHLRPFVSENAVAVEGVESGPFVFPVTVCRVAQCGDPVRSQKGSGCRSDV